MQRCGLLLLFNFSAYFLGTKTLRILFLLLKTEKANRQNYFSRKAPGFGKFFFEYCAENILKDQVSAFFGSGFRFRNPLPSASPYLSPTYSAFLLFS